MLGNIRFIGELYKKGMIVEKIMHECIYHLISNINNPNEEDLVSFLNSRHLSNFYCEYVMWAYKQ